MKVLLKTILAGLVVSGSAGTMIAQDAPTPAEDRPVTIQPEAEVEAAPVHEHTVDGGWGVMDDRMVHDAPHERRMDRLGHAIHDRNHPHPFYAHGRAGEQAQFTHDWNAQQAMMTPWHGAYYHRQYGRPVALIVPPTAAFQTNYSWGVGRTTSTPIYHQFARPYPGTASGEPVQFRRTPHWPSHTRQFGVYPVRGPW